MVLAIWYILFKNLFLIPLTFIWIVISVDSFLKNTFYFSDFIVDPQANLLIKKSSQKRLESKIISLLSFLASSDNKVISKQQIREAIWPNVVVGDETIAKAIFTLRRALADDAKNPKYIETIPKKGYRFIVKANLVEEGSLAKESSSTLVSNDETRDNCFSQTAEPQQVITSSITFEEKIKTLRFSSKLFFSLIILFCLVFILAWGIRSNDNDFSTIDKILPVTSSVGNERDFSINAFTDEIVYVHDDGDRATLSVKSLSNNELPRELTQFDGWLYSPLWLDKHTVIYVRGTKGRYLVIRKYKEQEEEVVYSSSNSILQLALNPSSPQEVTFTEFHRKKEQQLAIKTLNLINGKVSSLRKKSLDIPEKVYDLIYSADGSTLYFTSDVEQEIRVHSLILKSGERTIVGEPFEQVSDLVLGINNQLLVAGARSGMQGLWTIILAEQGTKLLLPASSGQKIISAGVDKRGNIYYANYEQSIDLAMANKQDNLGEGPLESLALMNTSADEYGGVFSASGHYVYFTSNRTGYEELWSHHIASGTNKQLTQLEASHISSLAVSVSGKYLAFVYRNDKLNLSVINIENGQLESNKVINNMKYPLAWSKDAKSIFISEHIRQVNLYQYDRETLTSSLVQEFAGLSVTVNSENSISFVDYKQEVVVEKNLATGQLTTVSLPIENLNRLMPGQLRIGENSVFYQNYNANSSTQKKQKSTWLIQQNFIISNHANTQVNSSLAMGDKIKATTLNIIELPEKVTISDISQAGDKLLYSKQAKPQGGIMKMQVNNY